MIYARQWSSHCNLSNTEEKNTGFGLNSIQKLAEVTSMQRLPMEEQNGPRCLKTPVTAGRMGAAQWGNEEADWHEQSQQTRNQANS